MIDLILVCTLGAAFFLGFKAGNKYSTIPQMIDGLKAKIKEL